MEDFADVPTHFTLALYCGPGETLLGELADSDRPFRFENFEALGEVCITYFRERFHLGGAYLVRGDIPSTFVHKNQRAIIGDEVIFEKRFRRFVLFREKAP